MKSCIIFILSILICVGMAYNLSAQSKDSVKVEKELKNTIRFNFSTPLIFGHQNMIFGYERVVGRSQSFSVNFGAYGLPGFFSSDSLSVSHKQNSKGFNFSVDYRFYITSENRHPVPRGVYIGPYYSVNHLSRQNTWNFNTNAYTGSTDVSLGVDIQTVGIELGYQFVFFKRLAVDFVAVGPGMGHYSFKAKIKSNLEPQQRDELLTAIGQSIKDKVPGISGLFNRDSYRENSGVSAWTIGYRYLVHIGFRF